MLSYYLREIKNSASPALPIYARILIDRHDWKISTGFRATPACWDGKKGRVVRGPATADAATVRRINEKLKQLSDAVNNYCDECRQCYHNVERVEIDAIVESILDDKPKTFVEDIPSKSISAYADYLIEAMERGDFKNAGEDYGAQTVKMWKVFSGVLKDFETAHLISRRKALHWDDLGKETYDLFIGFCKTKGFMTSTINKYIGCFTALIKYAARYHNLHKNEGATAHFHRLRVKVNDEQARIYLSASEVKALYYLDLPPGSLYDQVRDVFLAGVYCGQRFSDYGRLSPEHFTVTERGTRVIRLTQKKTGHTVVVPFLDDNLLALARKYNYSFPNISEVIVNRYIKKICKALSEKVPSLADRVPTALTLRDNRAEAAYRTEHDGENLFERDEYGRVVKPRYELVTTHTARRTAITNLFKSHQFSTYQLMAISGHKSLRNLLLYVRESGNEVADEIDAILRQKDSPRTAENLF